MTLRRGIAYGALVASGVTREDIQARLAAIAAENKDETPDVVAAHAAHFQRVVEGSLREAMMLGDNFVDTEHILLSIIRDGGLTVAMQILIELGVKPLELTQIIIGEVTRRQIAALPKRKRFLPRFGRRRRVGVRVRRVSQLGGIFTHIKVSK